MVDRINQEAIQIHAVAGVRSTALATPSGLVKWNPGLYALLSQFNPTIATFEAFLDNSTSGLAGLSSDVKGIQLWTTWGFLETAKGVYADQYMDDIYDACESRGFRLSLYISDTRFGSTSTVGFLPQYLATLSGGAGGWINVGQTNSDGVIAKRYNPAVMDRLAALSTHWAGRFNTATHFESLATITETEMAVDSGNDPAFSETGYLNQLERYAQEIKSEWTRTIVTFGPNSGFSSDVNWSRLWEMMRVNAIGRAPPDIRPTDFPPAETNPLNYGNIADAYYLGNKGAINGVAGAKRDYRGLIPSLSRIEDPDYAKYGKPFANDATYKGVAGFHRYGVTILNDSHQHYSTMNYVYGATGVGANQVKWSNATIQPDPVYRTRSFFDAGGHAIATAPPSCYAGVVTG